MTKEELAKPDNGADCTIMLPISGNRLVSVLNAFDAALFAAGIYRFEGNDLVAVNDYYATIRATTEAIRDELSRGRAAARS